MSVGRAAFLDVGGFNSLLDINEHRELALRLCQRGLSMVATKARTYHMTHRSGWRDPLENKSWENIFFDAHPTAEVALLPVLWASLADGVDLPEAARLRSLPELAAAAKRCSALIGREAMQKAHLRWADTGAVG